MNTSGVNVGAGEYYIYRADSISKPDWSTARVLKLNLRTYYNVILLSTVTPTARFT